MVSARIALVRAPNPSAMTLTGTNSYLIDCGDGQAACIDPGPAMERHIDALVDRAEKMQRRIAAIFLTHAHPDHAPGALLLQQRTGAAIAASARSTFPHERDLQDGEVARIGSAALHVMESPGHTFDHLVYYEPGERALFTGDTVLGEGYVVIAPPNGAMRPYQRTLARMLAEFADAGVLYGGHGEPVHDPAAKIRDYIAHRESREAQLRNALAQSPGTIPDLVQRIYGDAPRALWPAAARQLLAYLIALEQEGSVRSSAMNREMTAQEHAVLNPEWETIVGSEQARIVEEELGASLRVDALAVYALAANQSGMRNTILPN